VLEKRRRFPFCAMGGRHEADGHDRGTVDRSTLGHWRAIWLSLSGRTVPLSGNNAPGTKLPSRAQSPVDGRELFHREWVPKDSRSHGGDGLGPLYNDTSCVACHSQGGPGGGGPSSKNVQNITAASRRGSPCFLSERRRVGPGSRPWGTGAVSRSISVAKRWRRRIPARRPENG